MYVRELRLRLCQRRVSGRTSCECLTTPKAAAELIEAILRHESTEVAGLLCLTARHTLIAYRELSRGTLDQTIIHPRDVFAAALLANASAVILGHNHPSGHPQPSVDDAAVTSRIVAAGVLMGVEVLDHIIVSTPFRYFSFREAGRL